MSDNKDKSNHYVDNVRFLEAIKERKVLIAEAEAAGNPKPQISDELGKYILLLVTNYSKKSNWQAARHRAYLDEMVDDAIENCILYFDNFDTDKYSNPFAYYTQIAYYAFIRRIEKEEKKRAQLTEIKETMLASNSTFDAFHVDNHDDASFYYSDIEYLRD